jgi:hypothetical protein
LTGTVTGQLLTWGNDRVCANPNAPPLHQGALDAICVSKAHIITGGRDRILNILSAADLSVVFSVSLAEFGSVNG